MKRRQVQKPTHKGQKGGSLSLEALRKSMEESKHGLKKLKKHQSAMEFHIMEFNQKANNLEAASKKMVVQWAKACEIIVERERNYKVVKEDAASLISSPAAKSAGMVMMKEEYLVEFENVKKRLLEDIDEVCEFGDGNMQHAIAQDLQECLIEY